ncbi:MAG: MBL fold metallo-hydrolase [Candidatus Tectomicrobia bacterium]|nr:MBL fold metallo-hydrolase [Candidatus Tectomicrobia bacterium]
MDLTVLGSGTGVPTAERGPAGYLLQIGGSLVQLDSGAGASRALVRLGFDYRLLASLLYTHLHADHVGDLVPLLMAQRITPGFSRRQPLRIYAPRGFRRFLATLAQAYGPWVETPEYELTIQELWEDRLAITAGDTPWSLRCLPMNHPTCIGYRIEAEGASLVYSGDTDVCENIVKLARRADVLILECSFHDDEKVEGHLTPAEAGAIANRAECRTLLLTHFYPGTDGQACVEQCRKLCDAEVLAAYDGLRLRLGP